MSDHIFVCINRKCKLYKKERTFATSTDAKCKCGRIMRYIGEQGRLDFEKKAVVDSMKRLGNLPTSETETMRPRSKRSVYDQRVTLSAVFEVQAARGVLAAKENSTICHIEYIGIRGDLSRGAVIPLLKKRIIDRYRTSKVEFKFWCDTWSSTGGSPSFFHMEDNKVVEEER